MAFEKDRKEKKYPAPFGPFFPGESLKIKTLLHSFPRCDDNGCGGGGISLFSFFGVCVWCETAESPLATGNIISEIRERLAQIHEYL